MYEKLVYYKIVKSHNTTINQSTSPSCHQTSHPIKISPCTSTQQSTPYSHWPIFFFFVFFPLSSPLFICLQHCGYPDRWGYVHYAGRSRCLGWGTDDGRVKELSWFINSFQGISLHQMNGDILLSRLIHPVFEADWDDIINPLPHLIYHVHRMKV